MMTMMMITFVVNMEKKECHRVKICPGMDKFKLGINRHVAREMLYC